MIASAYFFIVDTKGLQWPKGWKKVIWNDDVLSRAPKPQKQGKNGFSHIKAEMEWLDLVVIWSDPKAPNSRYS